jgi:hypothetical protein
MKHQQEMSKFTKIYKQNVFPPLCQEYRRTQNQTPLITDQQAVFIHKHDTRRAHICPNIIDGPESRSENGAGGFDTRVSSGVWKVTKGRLALVASKPIHKHGQRGAGGAAAGTSVCKHIHGAGFFYAPSVLNTSAGCASNRRMHEITARRLQVVDQRLDWSLYV